MQHSNPLKTPSLRISAIEANTKSAIFCDITLAALLSYDVKTTS